MIRSFLRFSLLAHELGQASALAPGVIRRRQRQRLRKLVAYAKAHSPFYRERLAHLDPQHFRLSDIPPVAKQEIRDRLDDVFTDRLVNRAGLEIFASDDRNLGRWHLGKYAVSHTSGSQGAPLWIVQDRSCLELLFATMVSRASASRNPGLVEGLKRLARPRRIAIVTFRRGFYPSGASLEFLPQILGPFVRVLRLSSMQDDLVEQLRRFQPHVISSYASVLEALAESRQELQLRCLQQITNSSEQLVERARRRIESAFQAPVVDHYGAGECLWLADSCTSPRGGLHINSDWTIVEVVDEHGRPVPDDTVGARILVTNLVNYVQPFLRYEIGDRVRLSSQSCDCGSRLPRISAIEGREAELFWIEHQGRRRFLSGVLFHTAVDELGVVREWQACQLSTKHIELRLQLLDGPSLSWTTVSEQLRKSLYRLGLPDSVVVSCVLTPHIAPDPKTGKMRRMIPYADAPSTESQ